MHSGLPIEPTGSSTLAAIPDAAGSHPDRVTLGGRLLSRLRGSRHMVDAYPSPARRDGGG